MQLTNNQMVDVLHQVEMACLSLTDDQVTRQIEQDRMCPQLQAIVNDVLSAKKPPAPVVQPAASNTLDSLNRILFDQLRVLQSTNDVSTEVERSRAMVNVADTLIDNYRLGLDIRRFAASADVDVTPTNLLEKK